MQEVRKRRNERQNNKGSKQHLSLHQDSGQCGETKSLTTTTATADNESENCLSRFSWLWRMCQFLFGIAVACYIGYRYSSFVKLLHENDMWFSEISVSAFVSLSVLVCIFCMYTWSNVSEIFVIVCLEHLSDVFFLSGKGQPHPY